jgi:restriction system protein
MESGPSQRALMWPVVAALRNHGGTATVAELDEAVCQQAAISDSWLQEPRRGGKRSEIAYRCAWARTRLRKAGFIERIGRLIEFSFVSRQNTRPVSQAGVSSFRILPRPRGYRSSGLMPFLTYWVGFVAVAIATSPS